MQRPIYIIGAGAIGMTLAVFLQQAGRDVYLLRGRPGEAAEGDVLLTVECSDGAVFSTTIRTGTLAQLHGQSGIVLLTTKAFGNAELAGRLRNKTGSSPVVLLQNGLGIEQPFLDAGFPALYRCVLLATSQVQAPHVVSYKPVAASPVGLVLGQEAELAALIEQITTPQFAFRAETAIERAIWEKVITNCVFNSVCPLLEVDNGIFHRDASVLALAREVVAECVAVARLAGIHLDQAGVVDRLLQISQRSNGQLISTLVDIREGRDTEIDVLNGAVARLAQQLGEPGLATRTRFLGELVNRKANLQRVKYSL